MKPAADAAPWHGNVTAQPGLYDLLHGDNQEDIPLYERLSKGLERVLECGVGTGRIAISLARKGRTVYGIDSSPEMLAQLRRNLSHESGKVAARVRVELGDMRLFEMSLTFRLVYIPFMTFNYLPSVVDQLACLDRMRAHLDVGGTLVMELMSYHREWFHDDGVPRVVLRRLLPDARGHVEVLRVTRFDASTQIMEHDRFYRFFDSGGRLESEQVVHLRNRFFFLGEASMLLERCGFAIRNVWGDHRGGPYTRGSQVMILVAEKLG